MLAKQKEQYMTEVIRGPVMIFGLAIAIIAAAVAMADAFAPGADNAPDEKPLFGGFFTDAIAEVVFYIRWIIYLTIMAGGVMVGLSLRLKVHRFSKIPHDKGR